jgi:hypothetical protein
MLAPGDKELLSVRGCFHEGLLLFACICHRDGVSKILQCRLNSILVKPRLGMVQAWVGQKLLKRDILRVFTMSD